MCNNKDDIIKNNIVIKILTPTEIIVVIKYSNCKSVLYSTIVSEKIYMSLNSNNKN